MRYWLNCEIGPTPSKHVPKTRRFTDLEASPTSLSIGFLRASLWPNEAFPTIVSFSPFFAWAQVLLSLAIVSKFAAIKGAQDGGIC